MMKLVRCPKCNKAECIEDVYCNNPNENQWFCHDCEIYFDEWGSVI